jgi:hypothetical protein
MSAGNDSTRHALEVYADFKPATGWNGSEACAAYEQLKAVYPGKGRKRRAADEAGQT